VGAVSFLVLVYCVANGTIILNIFSTEGQGVMQSYAAARELKNVVDNDNNKGIFTLRDTNREPLSPSAVAGGSSSSVPTADSTSGTFHERLFFHLLMVFFCSYAAMIMTSWGNTDGSPDASLVSGGSKATESMWLKISSQWVFLLLYAKILHTAYLDNTE
jgi:Serine incorporator (Serinc)